jgi:hypothetical protein
MGLGGQRHAPAALYQEWSGTQFTEGWMDPRDGLKGCGTSRPHRVSILACPTRGELLYRQSYSTDKCNAQEVSKINYKFSYFHFAYQRTVNHT